MSNLKCPFCQQELEETMFARGRVFMSCNNPNCIISDWGGCSKQIITELIHTRKALEIAVSQLKKTSDYIEDCRYQETNYFLVDSKDVSIILDETNDALEQITATRTKG